MTPDSSQLLGHLPSSLRDALIETFNEVLRNYREHRWEPSELNGGKLCEVVYTILRGHADGRFPQQPFKPPNMVDSCRALEKADKGRFSRSVRIQIPRMLIALYEIRNNRGVGHVGGDVDACQMDAGVVVAMAQWLMAELVRLFHTITPEEATMAVASIVERQLPVVWKVADRRRLLRTDFTLKQQVLVLLYEDFSGLSEKSLAESTEKPAYVLRRDALRPLHKAAKIHYMEDERKAVISPTGRAEVEELMAALSK